MAPHTLLSLLVLFSVASLCLADCPDLATSKCQNHVCGSYITGSFALPIPNACGPRKKGGPNTQSGDGWQCIGVYSPGTCCQMCKDAGPSSCMKWIHSSSSGSCGEDDCGLCIHLTSSYSLSCGSGGDIKVGGSCSSSVSDDPHFVGARGTRFDFNGEPDKAFCLATDDNFHINMLLHGYYDKNTAGATVVRNGKAVRTWIRELGILFKDESGKQHKFRMVARKGKQQERGAGFVSYIAYDDMTLPKITLHGNMSLAGGMTINNVGQEKFGRYDVDHYRVRVADLMDLDVKLRIASAVLQEPNDAHAHINVGFNFLKATTNIHGVLGQTYRADRTQRAIDYTALSHLLHGPVIADGETGKGFLDGAPSDYVVPDVMSSQCKFSTFTGNKLPAMEYVGLSA